jgi:hypothetical protein
MVWTLRDTVIRAAQAVADAPHDQAAVARLKHDHGHRQLSVVSVTCQDDPRVFAHWDKLFEEMMRAIVPMPSKCRKKA